MENGNVRLADLAICSNRMLIQLLRLIWSVGYHDVHNHPGGAVEMMLVSMQTAIATREGNPMTASEIATELTMPYSNVGRHLEHLVRLGRVKRVKRRYVHDLDQLDELMSSREAIEQAMAIVETCLRDWNRLLPLLDKQLK